MLPKAYCFGLDHHHIDEDYFILENDGNSNYWYVPNELRLFDLREEIIDLVGEDAVYEVSHGESIWFVAVLTKAAAVKIVLAFGSPAELEAYPHPVDRIFDTIINLRIIPIITIRWLKRQFR